MGTAAIIGSTVVGVVSASNAASSQGRAADSAANVQAEANKALRADLGPFRHVGEAALFEQAALLGLPVNFPGTQADGPVIDQDGNPVGGGFRDGVLRIPRGEDPIAVVPLPNSGSSIPIDPNELSGPRVRLADGRRRGFRG